MKDYLDYLVQWIRDVVYQAHATGVIIVISGGIQALNFVKNLIFRIKRLI